jgi:hypothetical protein
MKKHINQLVAFLVLTGSMAVVAQAQTTGRLHLRATIPFEFNVGQKTMPAGEYTITQINPSSDRTVLQLRRSDGRSTTLVQMNNVIGTAGSTISHKGGHRPAKSAGKLRKRDKNLPVFYRPEKR